MKDKLQDIMDAIVEQEQMLSVERFTNKDALDLGNFLIGYAKEIGITVSVALRRPNGEILFHHLMEGTNNNNQNWMRRKFNTVNLWNHCSLFGWTHERLTGETLTDHGFTTAEYIHAGGGIPIFSKNHELLAVLTISNLPHFKDHMFGMNGLAKWMGVEDIPAIEEP